MISDPVFTVTKDGISAPAFADVLAYFQAQARTIFGEDINLDADTQDGQLVAIFAAAISDVNAQAIATYNAFNPNTAQGVALDSAVKTNGLRRREATNSQVDLRIIGQAGTVITDGAALDSANQRWMLPDEVVIPVGGEVMVTAHAEKSGDIQAAAGSISRIGTPTLGWQSVTNPAAAVPGIAVETDAALRVRQSESTALPSMSLWEGVVGSLLSLDGVLRVSGVRNDEDLPTEEGIPGHTIAMIVDGGDAQTIGETIFKKKGEGVGTFGDVTVNYVDAFGFPNTVRFGRPVMVPVYVKLSVKPGVTYLSTVSDEIKARVAEYINSLAISDDVGIARVLASAIKDTATGVDTRFTVEEITIGKSSSALKASNVVIAWNEAASCALANVTVEVLDEKQKQ